MSDKGAHGEPVIVGILCSIVLKDSVSMKASF